ncbi:DUF3824 domain-containing protein [Actinocorallia lasiicapitis]
MTSINGTLHTLPDGFGRYTIPSAPAMAWSAGESRRRRLLGRLALCGILAVQAILSLRLLNTAYQDEALYLYAGHQYLDQWFRGGPPAPGDIYALYFSGAPYLYPVLGAAVDSVFGLFGARALSMACMAGVTTVVYAVTLRLFNIRAALFAAAAYAVIESTAYMGNFATYDAPALLLVAVAFWIVVRFDRSRDWPVVLTVPLLLSLAFATKYAAAMFAGPVIAFAVVAAWPHRGPVKALLRGLYLTLVLGAGVGLWLAYGGFLKGFQFTTINRTINTDATVEGVLRQAGEHAAVFLVLAAVGAVLYLRSDRMEEVPGLADGDRPGRVWRFFLAGGMVASGLLVPAYQAYIHTAVALNKHIGYGLLFAAPIVGVGLARLTGRHFRSPHWAIAAWLLLLVPGMNQADRFFNAWPDSTKLVQLLEAEVKPGGKYLSSTPQVQEYYLGTERSRQSWWVSTYDLVDPYLEKSALADVKHGKFDMIMLDERVEPGVNAKVVKAIQANHAYRLRARFYYGKESKQLYGNYMVWTKLK